MSAHNLFGSLSEADFQLWLTTSGGVSRFETATPVEGLISSQSSVRRNGSYAPLAAVQQPLRAPQKQTLVQVEALCLLPTLADMGAITEMARTRISYSTCRGHFEAKA